MKTLKKAIQKLTWIDAVLWGQMLGINLVAAFVKYPQLSWGILNTLLSSLALELIFNTVKF